MSRSETDTRERILQCAHDLFYREGFARVSVDAIADAADVTKRTVYYHFRSKDDIVAEVLEFQHAHTLRAIQKWAGDSASSPQELVRNLFEQLQAWASSPGWLGSGFTRITAELADLSGHPARGAARRHKAAVEAWFEQQFARMGVSNPKLLARQIMLLSEGTLSLMLVHGDPTYAAASGRAACALVAEQTKPMRS